jgi:hypothetical protein
MPRSKKFRPAPRMALSSNYPVTLCEGPLERRHLSLLLSGTWYQTKGDIKQGTCGGLIPSVLDLHAVLVLCN